MGAIELLVYISSLILGYLFGSIPTGVIIGKLFFNVDIRTQGSHNTGGTNAGRVLGKKAGIAVIFIDALKIIIPFWVIFLILNAMALDKNINIDIGCYFSLLGACLGHCFSIFIGFKGGKAVSTFAGCLLATNWILFIIFIITFLIVLKISKFVSLSSIVASCFSAFISLLLLIFETTFPGMWRSLEYVYFYSIILIISSLLVMLRHKDNIKRLSDKKERKITWMK